jgi:hypothetical protein
MKSIMFKIVFNLRKILLFSAFLFLLTAVPLLAADFNPHYIIADEDVLAKDAMSATSIQKFLEEKDGALASYTCLAEGKDENGNQITPKQITASQAFYEVSQRWNISPKFLLVLVQKEQSLVEDPTPTQKQYDWATGYAVCDGCSLDDPAIQRWKGFYKQINSAAAQFQYYLENPSEFRYQKGQTYTIDGVSVTPNNIATAALYNYTPHIHGNDNFYTIWNRWFSRTYPDGSLVQIKGESGVWYIQYGTRRPIKSKIALVTRFDEKKIINISPSDLESYPLGWPISLANYSLVRSPQKQIYLIVDDEKRPILSTQVFKKIGWNPEEVEDVTEADLANFLEGEVINENSIYPQGILAQDTKTGGIYYISDGVKYPIFSKEIMAINYPNRTLIKLTPEELTEYQTGEPVKFKDGTLIKPKEYAEVYVVSNGKRRWLPDEATFIGLGYKWENIVTTSYQAVALHPLGDILTL